MKYYVYYILNDIPNGNLAVADSEQAVLGWYKMYNPGIRILSLRQAMLDDEKKPGIPCIEIGANYLPYVEAADQMSLILQHAKNMSCRFYVMDEAYYGDLAFSQLSADNRGQQLTIGDWYVIVTCSNGHKYYVNVTCDSVVTMCAEVFDFIQCK